MHKGKCNFKDYINIAFLSFKLSNFEFETTIKHSNRYLISTVARVLNLAFAVFPLNIGPTRARVRKKDASN